MDPTKFDQSMQKLTEAIGFRREDLELNEKGYFSESQINKLMPKIELYIWLLIIAAFFSFCLALIGFFTGNETTEATILTTVFVAIFGFCVFGTVWSINQKSKILKGYGVKKIEGWAHLSIIYTGDGKQIPNYFMHIHDVQFKLDEKTFDAFEKRDYRVYYYELLRNELLAAELLN